MPYCATPGHSEWHVCHLSPGHQAPQPPCFSHIAVHALWSSLPSCYGRGRWDGGPPLILVGRDRPTGVRPTSSSVAPRQPCAQGTSSQFWFSILYLSTKGHQYFVLNSLDHCQQYLDSKGIKNETLRREGAWRGDWAPWEGRPGVPARLRSHPQTPRWVHSKAPGH